MQVRTLLKRDGIYKRKVTKGWKCGCGEVNIKPLLESMESKCLKCEHDFSQMNDHFVCFDFKEIFQTVLPSLLLRTEQLTTFDDYWIKKQKQIVGAEPCDFTITLNTDGAPLFSSSNCSLWPLLCHINIGTPCLRKKNVFLLAFWVSRKNKPDFDIFLASPMEQLCELASKGLEINIPGECKASLTDSPATKCRIFVSSILCDSIARPVVQNMMQFNATYGCGYCYYQAGGHYFEHKDRMALRSHEQHLKDCEQAMQGGSYVKFINPVFLPA